MTSHPIAASQPVPGGARAALLRALPVAVGVSLVALILSAWSLATGVRPVAAGWAWLALGLALLPGWGSALAPSERSRLRLAAVTLVCALGGAGLIAASLAL